MQLNTFFFLYLFHNLTSITCQKTWTKNEFKYLITAGKIDCFFQPVELNSVFHASIQVIKGSDISFYIIDSNHTIIYTMQSKESGSHQVPKSPVQGDYQICIDNLYSIMTDKLVYLYILTFHSDKMMEKVKENQAFNETASITKQVTDRIYLNLIEVFTHQALGRFKQNRDAYIIEANNSLVFYWSLFQSILIILCGVFQAYFIKRLFQVTAKNIIK